MGAHKRSSVLKELDEHDNSLMGSNQDADLHLEIPIDDPSQVVLHKEML